jgi:release factor glutamine methyltransferase
MRRVSDVLQKMFITFQQCLTEQPRRQAEDLLSEFFHCSRIDLYGRFYDYPLTETEWQTCEKWLQRRLLGEPLAYITKRIDFYNCQLEITPHVLIPRQETEILVDKISDFLSKQDLEEKILWDICCGSGCIGIALKKKHPALQVYATDISLQALTLAENNAKKNQVAICFLEGDLFSPFAKQKAHYIVCNPPYLSSSEYVHLDQTVKKYEPVLALVGGNTGLEFYDRLAKELPDHLFPCGRVWLEIGYQQGVAVHQIFDHPLWKTRTLQKDWSGHDRFFFLENE